MKRKLIEMHQEYSIVCDNRLCDYKIKSETGDPNEDISGYLNKPCPNCGQNLLTEKDYAQSLKVLGVINWLNRWFSWIAYLTPKKAKRQEVFVHVHKGVHIQNKDLKGE